MNAPIKNLPAYSGAGIDPTTELAKAIDRLASALERMEAKGDVPKRQAPYRQRVTDYPRSSEEIHT